MDDGGGRVRYNGPALEVPIAALRPTTDPTEPVPGPRNAVERWFAARLKDERDLIFVRNAAELSLKMGTMAVLYITHVLPLWTVVLWWPWMMARYQGRFTLMLHATSHRLPFKRKHAWMNHYLPWVLGPLFGHTPDSFYVHHLGMHHPENNEEEDLSSTIAYQRDKFSHFLHYWARFFFTGYVHLYRYLVHRKRSKLATRFLRGELAWIGVVAFGLWWDWSATVAVLVGPMLLIRFFMMTGNWAQHSFVDVDDPGNAYRNSTNLINARYNHLCYNDGYHIVHHLKPSLHYTEMATWFHDRAEAFGAQDALVFDGLGNNQSVWWCLMSQNWDKLAEHLVDLPGAPERTHEEKVAMLQDRVRRRVGDVKGLTQLAEPPPQAMAAK